MPSHNHTHFLIFSLPMDPPLPHSATEPIKKKCRILRMSTIFLQWNHRAKKLQSILEGCPILPHHVARIGNMVHSSHTITYSPSHPVKTLTPHSYVEMKNPQCQRGHTPLSRIWQIRQEFDACFCQPIQCKFFHANSLISFRMKRTAQKNFV